MQHPPHLPPVPTPTSPRLRSRFRPRPRLALAGAALTAAIGLSGCLQAQGPAPAASSGPPSGSASGPASEASGGSAEPGTAAPSPGAGDAAPVQGGSGTLPDQATRTEAEQAVAGMSVEEKAGQVLVATWDGADPGAVDAQIEQIDDLHLGGVIVMGSNVPTATGQGTTEQAGAEGGAQGVDVEAMAGQNRRVGEALAGDDRAWPGIISVDQEGGPVARLGAPLTQWPAASAIGAAGDPVLTREAASGLASELAGLGFTMDHAPVADVTTPGDAVILERAYGDDPEAVAEQVTAAVGGFQDAGLISSPKHFPGHGSVTTDSHVGLPVQQKTPEQLAETDWKPFRAAAEAGAPSIMMGHIAVDAWDPEVPATLEPQAYQALREDVGFEGVAVTDALNMGAVTDVVGPGQAVDTGVSTPAGAALQAGADLLLMPEDEQTAHRDIVQAVASGAIPQQRLDEAAARVVAMQMAYAQHRETAPVGPSEPGSRTELAARLQG